MQDAHTHWNNLPSMLTKAIQAQQMLVTENIWFRRPISEGTVERGPSKLPMLYTSRCSSFQQSRAYEASDGEGRISTMVCSACAVPALGTVLTQLDPRSAADGTHRGRAGRGPMLGSNVFKVQFILPSQHWFSPKKGCVAQHKYSPPREDGKTKSLSSTKFATTKQRPDTVITD